MALPDSLAMKHRALYESIARACAEKSHAVRKKVGAVIVSPNGSIISHGWNGMPAGMDNCCEIETSPGVLVTRPEVLHAELNAIGKAAEEGRSLHGATLFVTLSPCLHEGCSKLIHRCGIAHVHYLEAYRDLSGVEFLRGRGVFVSSGEDV